MLRYAAMIIVLLAVVTGCATKSLVTASKEGDIDAVKRLMENRESEYTGADKCLSMIWAAEYGYLEVVRYLAGRGVDVNCSAGGGWTPLMRAAATDQMEVLKYLIGQGARVETKTIFGSSPLSSAAERGHIEVVRLLAAGGADLDGAIAYLKGQLREDPKNSEAKKGLALLEDLKRQAPGRKAP